MNNITFRAAVVGATGYTGQELLQLLRRHPRLQVTHATSEAEAGRAVPGFELRYEHAASVDLGSVDVVFTCLPTGESGQWAMRGREAGARVVDLSADLRHSGSGAVYGLPELWRDEIRGAPLVANPGCYPTGLLLALAPLLREGLVADGAGPIIVDAASGVTGAGRGAKRDLLFGEVAEDYRAYGVGNTHRHVPEISAALCRLNGGSRPSFVFTPHLLPVRRGILETIYIPVPGALTASHITSIVKSAYGGEPFIEVLPAGQLPAIRDVAGTNRVVLGFADVALPGVTPGDTSDGAAAVPAARARNADPAHGAGEGPAAAARGMVVGVVAFDNLLKGAAGQALQNANLMLGLCEEAGLRN